MEEAKQNNSTGEDSVLPLIRVEQCHTLELIAMLERVSNYGQTGNVKVIARRSMDQFYLSAVVLHGSLPYMSNAVKFVNKNNVVEVTIDMNPWPQDPMTRAPVLASFASIKYHYNLTAANVRIFYLFPVSFVMHFHKFGHLLLKKQLPYFVTCQLLINFPVYYWKKLL
jgi:hypothetical protein